jgi:hypothetical protein
LEHRYYYCYSRPQKDFFIENGLKEILVAIHPKTKKRYWVFDGDETLNALLTQWRLHRKS